jgi:hypothetical protein
MFQYRVHKSTTFVLMLNQMNSIRDLESYCSDMNFNICLHSKAGFPGFLFFTLFNRNLTHFQLN